MSSYRLSSPEDATREIAKVFAGTGIARIEVLEDKCFAGGGYWNLGEVRVRGVAGDVSEMFAAVSHGAYQWEVPTAEEALAQLIMLLEVKEPTAGDKPAVKEQHQKILDRVRRIMDAVATAAVRVGLTHPIFDPNSVEEMPFRRGTTVIADTSGALQGGLDFVSRFLHPTARIKVPAVVHMEVVNQADSFLKRRRATKVNSSALLFDHLLSQAGQRVLLRLEFRDDTEVERTLLVGDPLRNAFQRDSDQEWSDLNLSVPLRSYCDRLIIEAARQHQAHASPGHPIQLLTADQGLARMALAEGIAPLYFRAVSANSFFGRTLAGTAFNPLGAGLYQISLQAVLWEFATAFGSARLITEDGTRWVEATAVGEDLAWSPIHSRNDLLWLRSEGLPEGLLAVERHGGTSPVAASASAPPKKAKVAPTLPRERQTKPGGPAFYRLNPEKLFQVIANLAREGQLTEERAMRIAGANSKAAFLEYQRFLAAGDLAQISDGSLLSTERTLETDQAFSSENPDDLAAALRHVPSVDAVLRALGSAVVGTPVNLGLSERADTTYKVLCEVMCAGCPIAKTGFYPTPNRPRLEEFSEVAVRRFNELDTGDGFVSVGLWLESLAKEDGVHPERSRRYLDEASAAGLVNRSTEGSTTDTRHDQHAVRVLRNGSAGPRIDTVHLYRGDFLVPNKSSSSIRLARPTS